MAGDSGPFFAIFPLTAFGPTAALAAFFLGTQAEEVGVVVAATDAAAAPPAASSTIEAEATGTQAGGAAERQRPRGPIRTSRLPLPHQRTSIVTVSLHSIGESHQHRTRHTWPAHLCGTP
eukprot:GHVU01207585.1.p1 GENE.GHVU01207585.1~~GHVU01207585.1.p1  ORF type:complete len:120 (-),score=10.85 GHVU01207585.1:341-700(-)